MSSKRLQCELTLQQQVLVYLERQKKNKKQNSPEHWSINLVEVKQIFALRRMRVIQYFLAKRNQGFCES